MNFCVTPCSWLTAHTLNCIVLGSTVLSAGKSMLLCSIHITEYSDIILAGDIYAICATVLGGGKVRIHLDKSVLKGVNKWW